MKALIILFLGLLASEGIAQQGNNHAPARAKQQVRRVHPNARPVRVVRRSVYRPAKVVVYRPVWGPACSFNRRWVYFPYRNYYWDNWRNHYVFYNGTVWVSQVAPPPQVNVATIEKERRYELPEENDDLDSVYVNNLSHQQMKP